MADDGRTGRPKKVSAQHERIYDEIRADILAGRAGGGEKLLEADLARRFEVSRTQVREALYKLERDGLVERIVNVGFTVSKVDRQSIGDHLAVLTLLESHAAREWAAGDRAAADLPALKRLQQAMKTALAAKDVDAYETANRRFHGQFLEHNGNAYLCSVIAATKQKMFSLSLESYPSALHIEQYLADHDHILDRAENGTPDEVGEAMRRHLAHIGANISRV